MNKRVINEALRLCTNLWKAKRDDVIGNNCRKAEVVMAKRMFIYYLYNFVEVGHTQMKYYIKDISHATSIYHVREFNKNIDQDSYINKTFAFFMNEMRSFSIYGDEYDFKKQELEKIKVELNKLKK